ncbi:4-alpha-glucanotransferase [[Clostridium] hylemonae]|uniref:4-alpha-glucanotransferase n=1 Tax=[Clostridium] hylemonae TaxID=89153 RepID=UPI0036F1EA3B
MKEQKRISGILLHPTSLPSPYGIGDLGAEAYEFVDFLERAGQHIWQMLPLTHTGYGDSPYQSFSAFAGQPLLISPAHLKELDLVQGYEILHCPVRDDEHIDYGVIIPWKQRIFKNAYRRFLTSAYQDSHRELITSYTAFCAQNAGWLEDYALFMACKDAHGGVSWLEWEDDIRCPSPEYKTQLKEDFEKECGFYQFLQFLFFEEWAKLKAYANRHEIQIIGDLPIFVSMDSADVWANQHLFQLDSRGYPVKVAGVPPDYFSETGQLWGNPLYHWNAHEEDGFAWWISRMRHQLSLLDIVRIDHFRGFEAYWSVPYGEENAVHGEWVKAPGRELFRAVEDALGSGLPIIAEDLGVITPEVKALRDEFHFPGMKVLQFAFEGTQENDFLPHQFTTTRCACYTGTHDNDTTLGWYKTLDPACKEKVKRYTNSDGTKVNKEFIRLCMGSIAAYAVVPMQDVLSYGKEARMNIPGTASGNWNWRFKKGILSALLAKELKDMAILYGRY